MVKTAPGRALVLFCIDGEHWFPFIKKFRRCLIYNLKVLALVASKFKNTNGTDYANSWLRSRYNQ